MHAGSCFRALSYKPSFANLDAFRRFGRRSESVGRETTTWEVVLQRARLFKDVTIPDPTQPGSSCGAELRRMAIVWGVVAVLPLPVLMSADPTKNALVACLYLGMAGAMLVAEFTRSLGQPTSPSGWRVRMEAIAVALVVNAALFAAGGVAAGVETHFPFLLMSLLSVVPAVGIMPWMLRRVRNPYAAIILGSAVVFMAKLTGCIVARFVYGPDYAEHGYVAADWRTAKLMISIFWTLTVLASFGMLVADFVACRRSAVSSPPTAGP